MRSSQKKAPPQRSLSSSHWSSFALRVRAARLPLQLAICDQPSHFGLASFASQLRVACHPKLAASASEWWAHQDSNLEQAGYEPAALTVELWARDKYESKSSISIDIDHRDSDLTTAT